MSWVDNDLTDEDMAHHWDEAVECTVRNCIAICKEAESLEVAIAKIRETFPPIEIMGDEEETEAVA